MATHSSLPTKVSVLKYFAASKTGSLELYGITKLAGEAVALRLGELYSLDMCAVRLDSVFGPLERETAARETMSIFLQIARLALRREQVVLPRQIHARDWIYSRDVAAGLVALMRAANLRYRLFHLTSGLKWTGGLLHWCEALAATIDGFTYRQAESGQRPNVRDSAARDRAPMRVDRVRADIDYAPSVPRRPLATMPNGCCVPDHTSLAPAVSHLADR